MNLPDPARDFILHWGEMGSRWGVNRSVAQIHALLYLSERPLPADAIVETLGIARSNVSTGLKELQAWRLVRTAPVLGDRRDHFVAEDDPLEMAKRIAEGRRQREIEPTIQTLETLVAAAKDDPAMPRAMTARIDATLGLMQRLDGWYREMMALPTATQLRLLKVGSAVARYLPGKRAKD